MSEDPRAIVAFEWWPLDSIESSMSLGALYFYSREEPGDTWGAPKTVAEEIPWTVALNVARSSGFNTEVAVPR